MKIKFTIPPFILACLILVSSLQAQNAIWKDASLASSSIANAEKNYNPKSYRTLEFDRNQLSQLLNTAPKRQASNSNVSGGIQISIPMPDGTMNRFEIMESSVFEPELAAKFPNIKSFTGSGLDDPTATMKLSISPNGLNGWISSAKHGDVFIDPYSDDTPDAVMSYFKKDLDRENTMSCEVQETIEATRQANDNSELEAQRTVGNCELHTFRLALACSGEYAVAIGGAGVTVADVMAEFNTAMARVNGLFERDAGITMVLVGNNDLLINLNGATDPYTNNDGIAMLGENQTEIDNVIGTANYDIGHVFSTGGGGVAALRSPCNANSKAQGVTGLPNPTGDPFYVDFVAHEMGHQYGAPHTFNGNTGNCGGGNRSASTAVEPASGSTIMAYAGICGNNVQNQSDALFHIVSIENMIDNITGQVSTCAAVTDPGNSPPTSDAGADYTIPGDTKFFLTGVATDPDAGTSLSYAWEQLDRGTGSGQDIPTPNDTDGPAFRAFLPSTSPTRYFPNLPDALANISPTYEVLSTVDRTMEFGFTVRDINIGYGCVATDETIVTIDGDTGPFLVTAPNTAVSWAVGDTQTVTWDVAGTTAAPVNAANVDILLSIDGGNTWPINLATAVPNDGSQDVSVPNNITSTARVVVVGSGNVFYDISNTNFEIISSSPTFTLTATPNAITSCTPFSDEDVTIDVNSVLGFTTPATLSASGLPGAATASFSTNPVTPGNSTTLTLGNLSSVPVGTYTINVDGTAGAEMSSTTISLTISNASDAPILISPGDGATDVQNPPILSWNAAANASTYNIQMATDPGFTNLVLDAGFNGTSVGVNGLANSTTYYWRVQGENDCGNGPWSTEWSFTTAAITDCYSFSGGPYTDVNGVSCFPDCTTPTIGGVEVWSNEGYVLQNLTGGVEYNFNYCTGYNPANWAGNITIAEFNPATNTAILGSAVLTIAGCEAIFTAPADGDYIAVIWDVCGNPELMIDNGFPSFACTGNIDLPTTVATVNGTYTPDYEYTDAGGWTHYIDGGADCATLSDDLLLLSVQKNGNNIGAVGDAGFSLNLVADNTASAITAPYTTQFSNDWYTMNRYWELTPVTEPTSDVGVRFYYTDADYNAVNAAASNSLAQHEDMRFWKINDIATTYNSDPTAGHTGVPEASGYDQDGFWNYTNAGSASTTNYSYAQFPDAGTGPFHVAEQIVGHFGGGGGGAVDASILPVELLSFTGQRIDAGNLIQWETASEINNDRFELERSSAVAAGFERIVSVSGAGNSASRVSYQHLDENPSEGTNFYRLKQIDFDGSVTYSDIIAIDYKASGVVILYPNPVRDELFLSFDNATRGEASIELYNASGQLLRSWQQAVNIGRERLSFNVAGVPAGAYVIRITSGKEVITQRFVKE